MNIEDKKTKKRYRADHLLEENGVDVGGMSAEDMDAVIRERHIQSPDKNELGQVQKFNMMFQTRVGANEDAGSITYLRPETAGGMFGGPQ